MFVLVVIAVTVTVVSGENPCLQPDDEGAVSCADEGFTTIPPLSEDVITL